MSDNRFSQFVYRKVEGVHLAKIPKSVEASLNLKVYVMKSKKCSKDVSVSAAPNRCTHVAVTARLSYISELRVMRYRLSRAPGCSNDESSIC